MILNENEILRQRLRENDLDFSDEDIEEFLKTDYIGDLDFSKTDIEYLPLKGSIKNISGNVYLSRCEDLTDLSRLTSVSGNVYLNFCKNLKDLGRLTSVGGDLHLSNCKNLKDLGNLTSVGGDLSLYNCHKLTSLGNLTSVGGEIYGFAGDKSKYPQFKFADKYL